MNHHNLKELEEIFLEAAADCDAGLDMQQFRIAMKRTMGEHIDDNELDMIFMKVDTNCDGTVDWDEYLSYMLLEYQEKENMFSMAKDSPFPNPMVEKSCSHIESICKISMLLAYARQTAADVLPTVDETGSRYITLSKEGILNIWASDWQLQKSCTLESSRGVHKPLWVTDMVCMSNCNCIVVSSTDYEVSFYSMTGNMMQRKFQIQGLKSCALTMDFNYSVTNPKQSILLWGDTNGGIYIMRIYDNPNICLFSSAKCPGNKCTPRILLKGVVPNVIASYFPNVHTGWVQQLKYYISRKQGQECFVSGSMEEEKALNFADVTQKVSGSGKEQSVVINRKSSFRIRKGVVCLDYDPDWNLIVTGSRDCDVRIWNPYVVSKSSAVLKGHTFAVIQVHVRGGEHQIISVSKDKNIRIWDLRDYSCKQNIHSRNVNLGRLDVSATFVNDRTKELILATNQIGLFQVRGASTPSHKRGWVRSHHKPITCVLYNKLFKQIVTGSDDSMVATWDLNTGTKTMQFCTERDVEITSMAFDPTYRRLATGSRNGSIALWNFNNGACLRRLPKTDELEIADVVFCKRRIVSAGWNKHVTTFADSYEDETSRRFKRCHSDDILSLAYHYRDSTMATASYDGDIFVWSMDTEDVVIALNMFESILPIHLPPNKKHSSSSSRIPLSSSTKRTQAWGSRQGTPTAGTSNVGTNLHTPESKIERWFPDYLPWNHQSDVTNDQDSESDDASSDGGSCASTDRKHSPAERVVNKLKFLQGRRSDENTATLIAAVANGFVAAWSVHQKGGLLGYFEAVAHKNEVVLAMETDEDSEILITGDSRGYIKMWDMSSYCNGSDVKQRRESFKTSSAPSNGDNNIGCFTDGRFTVPTYQPFSKPPPLIWSLRGHTKAVTSIVYIEEKELIGTGSTDCSVRLWTVNGRYLGTFGQKEPWKLQFPVKEKELSVLCPDDVRRVASPTTLRQIKGGVHIQWKQVQHAVNFMGKARGVFNITKKMSTHQEEIKEQFNDVCNSFIKEKAVRRNTLNDRRGSMTVWVGDSPHSILADLKANPMAERTFQKIQKEGIKSAHLGKINYKPKNRHKESKIDRVIRWSEQHPIIYRALPYSDIETPQTREIPECLRHWYRGDTKLAKHANIVIARQRALGFLKPVIMKALLVLVSIVHLTFGHSCFSPEGNYDYYAMSQNRQQTLNIRQAENKCKSLDGCLAFSNLAEVERFLLMKNKSNRTAWYIGLTKTERGWTWSDGSLLNDNLSNWQINKQLTNIDNCVALTQWSNYKWIVRSCSRVINFVCQRAIVVETSILHEEAFYPVVGLCGLLALCCVGLLIMYKRKSTAGDRANLVNNEVAVVHRNVIYQAETIGNYEEVSPRYDEVCH
nr:WD repeat-containing protein on Y chromosome isoform X2 [Ciona intestinalis]|eukprot:XP_026696669.1 WD repeat-containing protein on Y chromosome isoform X2 [Ciona intestinalis]